MLWFIKKTWCFSCKIYVLWFLILILPFLFYLPVEMKTVLYAYQFENVNMDTGFNSPSIYMKVFSINKDEAKLFFVEGENKERHMGNFYWFVKQNGQWKFTGRWQCVWTNLGGSASDFTWPPYF